MSRGDQVRGCASLRELELLTAVAHIDDNWGITTRVLFYEERIVPRGLMAHGLVFLQEIAVLHALRITLRLADETNS